MGASQLAAQDFCHRAWWESRDGSAGYPLNVVRYSVSETVGIKISEGLKEEDFDPRLRSTFQQRSRCQEIRYQIININPPSAHLCTVVQFHRRRTNKAHNSVNLQVAKMRSRLDQRHVYTSMWLRTVLRICKSMRWQLGCIADQCFMRSSCYADIQFTYWADIKFKR